MKLHRRWASRRAWRMRALLAVLLALVAWPLRAWLGGWALALPLLALLYPSRRQEARALAEIDRSQGLAYRTALETPPPDPAYQRLRREAEEVEKRARLPRIPWLALALAAGIWLAAGLLPPPRLPAATARQAAEPPAQTVRQPEDQQAQDEASPKSGGQTGRSPGAQKEAKPESGAGQTATSDNNKASDEQKAASGEATGEPVSPERGAAGEANTPAGGQYNEQQPAQGGAGELQPGGGEEAGDEEVSGGQVREKEGEGSKTAVENNNAAGGGDEEAAGGGSAGQTGGSASSAAAPAAMPVPPPQAPAQLPSPWQGGPPPAEVQRAAERYIEDNPLPPGAAEALKRYFELGD